MVALLFVRRVIGKDHHLIEIVTKSIVGRAAGEDGLGAGAPGAHHHAAG
jgi:hypothetical protein